MGKHHITRSTFPSCDYQSRCYVISYRSGSKINSMAPGCWAGNTYCMSTYFLIIWYIIFLTHWNLMNLVNLQAMQLEAELTEAEWRTYATANYAIIDSDNGLSPIQLKPLSEAAVHYFKWGLGNNYQWNWIKIQSVSFKKMMWKCRLQNGGHFLRLNVLINKGPVYTCKVKSDRQQSRSYIQNQPG